MSACSVAGVTDAYASLTESDESKGIKVHGMGEGLSGAWVWDITVFS